MAETKMADEGIRILGEILEAEKAAEYILKEAEEEARLAELKLREEALLSTMRWGYGEQPYRALRRGCVEVIPLVPDTEPYSSQISRKVVPAEQLPTIQPAGLKELRQACGQVQSSPKAQRINSVAPTELGDQLGENYQCVDDLTNLAWLEVAGPQRPKVVPSQLMKEEQRRQVPEDERIRDLRERLKMQDQKIRQEQLAFSQLSGLSLDNHLKRQSENLRRKNDQNTGIQQSSRVPFGLPQAQTHEMVLLAQQNSHAQMSQPRMSRSFQAPLQPTPQQLIPQHLVTGQTFYQPQLQPRQHVGQFQCQDQSVGYFPQVTPNQFGDHFRWRFRHL